MVSADAAVVLILSSAIFLSAGVVKGLVGFGLPTLSLGLLVLVTSHPAAMTLILIPSFVTNAVQAVQGGSLKVLVQRLWPFFAAAFVCVWGGARLLTTLPAGVSETLLGILLVLYAAPGLSGVRLNVPKQSERPVATLAGFTNGVLTGLTGSFTVPGVFFLQSIGLPRDQLVQAMGVLFLVSTCGLALSLKSVDLLEINQLSLSAAMVLPALAGQWAGIKVRGRLSEAAFRRLVFLALLGLGIYLTALGLAA